MVEGGRSGYVVGQCMAMPVQILPEFRRYEIAHSSDSRPERGFIGLLGLGGFVCENWLI